MFHIFDYYYYISKLRRKIDCSLLGDNLGCTGTPSWCVSRIRFVGGGTGTSRVRLGNVPNMCEVNPGRQDSSGTGLVREGDVPETFLQKIDVSI